MLQLTLFSYCYCYDVTLDNECVRIQCPRFRLYSKETKSKQKSLRCLSCKQTLPMFKVFLSLFDLNAFDVTLLRQTFEKERQGQKKYL